MKKFLSKLASDVRAAAAKPVRKIRLWWRHHRAQQTYTYHFLKWMAFYEVFFTVFILVFALTYVAFGISIPLIFWAAYWLYLQVWAVVWSLVLAGIDKFVLYKAADNRYHPRNPRIISTTATPVPV